MYYSFKNSEKYKKTFLAQVSYNVFAYPIGGKDANCITAGRPLHYGQRILMKVVEHRLAQETLHSARHPRITSFSIFMIMYQEMEEPTDNNSTILDKSLPKLVKVKR